MMGTCTIFGSSYIYSKQKQPDRSIMQHISQVKNRSPTETMYTVTAPHAESPYSGLPPMNFFLFPLFYIKDNSKVEKT